MGGQEVDPKYFKENSDSYVRNSLKFSNGQFGERGRVNQIVHRKGQMRIQQMAFMLVALFIFFAMVGLIYFSIYLTGLKNEAEKLGIKESYETTKKLAGSPEFAFTAAGSCTSCVDLDRAIEIRNGHDFSELWSNFNYLEIERIYPGSRNEQCNAGTYPNCRHLILIDKGGRILTKTSFVTLVRWDTNIGNYKYELGRIHVSAMNRT